DDIGQRVQQVQRTGHIRADEFSADFIVRDFRRNHPTTRGEEIGKPLPDGDWHGRVIRVGHEPERPGIKYDDRFHSGSPPSGTGSGNRKPVKRRDSLIASTMSTSGPGSGQALAS